MGGEISRGSRANLRYNNLMLIAFDFDGTLSDDEMIVLLGEQAGCADEIRDITERAMNGELSYAESLRERVNLLAGLSADAVTKAFEQVYLRPGGAELLRELADQSITTAILTGGFHSGVQQALAAQDAEVTTILANSLVSSGGKLTGEVTGPLVEGTKDEVLTELVQTNDVSLEETIAIGDGANDIPMLDVAGISIGFDPKPAVQSHCDYTVYTIAELSDLLTDVTEISLS